MEKIKVTIRVPSDKIAEIDSLGNRSEIINKAIIFYIQNKELIHEEETEVEDNSSLRINGENNRCESGFGFSDLDRCGLRRGHDGPCLFFCEKSDCPGYEYPDRIKKHKK